MVYQVPVVQYINLNVAGIYLFVFNQERVIAISFPVVFLSLSLPTSSHFSISPSFSLFLLYKAFDKHLHITCRTIGYPFPVKMNEISFISFHPLYSSNNQTKKLRVFIFITWGYSSTQPTFEKGLFDRYIEFTQWWID